MKTVMLMSFFSIFSTQVFSQVTSGTVDIFPVGNDLQTVVAIRGQAAKTLWDMLDVEPVFVGPGSMRKKIGPNLSCTGGSPSRGFGNSEEIFTCSFKPKADGSTDGD